MLALTSAGCEGNTTGPSATLADAEAPPEAPTVGPQGEWPHPADPCRPADATFGPGGSHDPAAFASTFAALDAALDDALSNPGPDGAATVRVIPGSYVFHQADSGALSVNALDGDVELCGDGGIASFVMPAPDAFRFMIGRVGVARFLNMEFDGVWPGVPSARSIDIINTRIANTSSECLFWSEAEQLDSDGVDDPVRFGRGYVLRSVFDGCRSRVEPAAPGPYVGHSMYLSNRGCFFVAVDSTFKSQGTLEVWRSLCRFNYFANNYFSNVRDIRVGREGTRDTAAAVDFPSCGLAVFRRNRFEIADDKEAILSRQRRPISGCDMPNQAELGTTATAGDISFPGESVPKIQQREFWAAVHEALVPADRSTLEAADALVLLSNPHLFPLILEDNEFVAIGESTASVVGMYSTYAVARDGAADVFLKVPYDEETETTHDGWTERHFGLAVGNRLTGFANGFWRSTHNKPIGERTLPEVQAWVETVLEPELLPRGFELTTPPSSEWLPSSSEPDVVCGFFENKYRWVDEPGTGFPPCGAE